MLKNILGVVAGYVAIVFVITCSFLIYFVLLGPDRAFVPGKFEPSTIWISGTFVFGVVGAIVGGALCFWIARTDGAIYALAGLLFVFGILTIIFSDATVATDAVRSGTEPPMEAFSKSVSPAWVQYVNPFLGAISVVIGGFLMKGKSGKAE